jgi:hypothetical protein
MNTDDKLKELNNFFDKAKLGDIKGIINLCKMEEFYNMKKHFKPVEFILQALFIYKNSRYYNENRWIEIINIVKEYPLIIEKIINNG